jgi:hypothetical protein
MSTLSMSGKLFKYFYEYCYETCNDFQIDTITVNGKDLPPEERHFDVDVTGKLFENYDTDIITNLSGSIILPKKNHTDTAETYSLEQYFNIYEDRMLMGISPGTEEVPYIELSTGHIFKKNSVLAIEPVGLLKMTPIPIYTFRVKGNGFSCDINSAEEAHLHDIRTECIKKLL